MGESYWERKQRHLNEDHAARRQESMRTARLHCSQAEIDRMTAEIEAARRRAARTDDIDPEFRRLGVEWMMLKSTVLSDITGDPLLLDAEKAAWCQTLRNTTLTERDEADLSALRARVVMAMVRYSPTPGRNDRLLELSGQISTLIEIRAEARAHW